jgi:hypothetical protein
LPFFIERWTLNVYLILTADLADNTDVLGAHSPARRVRASSLINQLVQRKIGPQNTLKSAKHSRISSKSSWVDRNQNFFGIISRVSRFDLAD